MTSGLKYQNVLASLEAGSLFRDWVKDARVSTTEALEFARSAYPELGRFAEEHLADELRIMLQRIRRS